ncbi:MAG TPA: nucleotidyltransferase family protein [Sedimentisphaerales bacterium]|nr:nucleotidyltransferase family protein [Sedimentisphaerales bacterium]
MINAIVLAAGRSERMGKLKPLLKFNDTTFLGQIISVLKISDVDRITVVLGAEAETIKNSVDFSGTNIVINKDYQRGQLSSLIAAIEQAPQETDAILLCLVDNPFITREVVNKVVSKFKETNNPIIVPVFNKERGHPTLFSRSLFNELLNAPEEKGARHVLYSNEGKILELEVSERGILIGIDTPENYKSHFGADP